LLGQFEKAKNQPRTAGLTLAVTNVLSASGNRLTYVAVNTTGAPGVLAEKQTDLTYNVVQDEGQENKDFAALGSANGS